MRRIEQAVANLDHWFDTMRNGVGYSGPVSHWWKDNLLYCGVGFDWRYEGIIIGYLELYKNTGDKRWLNKALRAGLDLTKAILPDGSFRNSAFEFNPSNDGTIHNAAADIGLLELSKVLKEEGDARYKDLFSAASKNIKKYLLGRLWDNNLNNFRNLSTQNDYAPNKSATIIEALLLYSEIKGVDLLNYILPALEGILRLQDKSGGVFQGSNSRHIFPFYSARCIPALDKLYVKTGEKKYNKCAKKIRKFLRDIRADSGFHQVRYPSGTLGKYPIWIAGLGDILRCACVDDKKGMHFILDNQDSIGGVRTAYGFNFKGRASSYDDGYEFRDILHVCGWNDKTFRYLSQFVENVPKANTSEMRVDCIFKGKEATYFESDKEIVVKDSDNRTLYRWRKGKTWAKMRYF